jgi:branched-chain amino acid transport system substrate-binding protein
MITTYGFAKVAIVSADDPFSLNVAGGAERWASRFNMEIVLRKTVLKGTRDFDSVARAAKETAVDAVIMCGHFNESVYMRQAMLNIDWYPKAYYASVGPAFNKYRDRLGHEAESTFTSTNWHYFEKLPFPEAKAFYESFVNTYQKEPSYQAATAYAAGMILNAAIEKAGSLDREKIRDTLSTLDIFTIIGRYGVGRTGMQIKHFQIILQWINGRKEVVWPLELSTAKPKF